MSELPNICIGGSLNGHQFADISTSPVKVRYTAVFDGKITKQGHYLKSAIKNPFHQVIWNWVDNKNES